MKPTITLTPNELDETLRFRMAFSPLIELSISYNTYKLPQRRVYYTQWVEEVEQALHGVSYPIMDVLIGHRGYIPDFLTPTPTSLQTDIEAELHGVLMTPPDQVQRDVQHLIQTVGESAVLQAIMVDPLPVLEQLVAEMRDYWQRTLAHHWSRMMAILQNDVLHHSRLMVVDGLNALIQSIGTGLEYEAGKLRIRYLSDMGNGETYKHIFDVREEALQIVPSVFSTQKIYYQYSDDWKPMIIYPSCGAGLWYTEPIKPLEALELTLGVPKARMLFCLQSPLTTTELAHRLILTAGAVSQQLKLLSQAGLVESFRNGKNVYYRLTERGEKLLALF